VKTLIRDATVVLPTGSIQTSVLIDRGKIAAIDAAVHAVADEVVSARGLHLMPGVIDDQVHFREPGLTHKEDLYTATRACAKGGVTTFLEMPNTNPTTTTCQRLEEKLALAAGKCLVNFGLYIGATPHNLAELKQAKRTPGIKIFIGSSTGDLLVDDQAALEAIFAETTLPICAHCEDEATVRANAARLAGTTDVADHSRVRDHAAAIIATRRAMDLAFRHRHRFHVLHVSTGDEADLLADHRNLITAEVCPHHLFFNTGDYARLGTLVQRLPAVENSLALLLNEVARGRCTIEQVVRWMCDAPARVWDLVGKGRIAVGYDADLVLVDLNKSATIRNEQQETKSRWSPWHGVSLTGWPVRTWVLGQEVFRDGQINTTIRGREAQFDHARGGYWGTA
jgi:dihydroorotase